MFAFRRNRFNDDLADEMKFHLEMKTAKNRSSGLPDNDARDAATRQFGNRTLIEEQSRDAWGWTGVEQFFQDIRYAFRSMRKESAFTAASVLTLALAIGANAAIFSIVEAVLLRPFPYQDAERLSIAPISMPDFRDLKESTHVFDDLAIWGSNQYTARVGGEAEQLLGALVSDRFFPMMGRAMLGRTFSESEVHQPLAVISYSMWTSRYGADAAVLGKTISLNGAIFTIIGVMPSDFQFPSAQFQVWVPLEHEFQAAPVQAKNRAFRIFRALGHARAGTSRAELEAEATAISSRLAKDYPNTNAGVRIRFTPLPEWILGDVAAGLGMLMAAAILVLVIACVNVANLMLARAVARSHEFGVRASLGAGRLRLIRQTLTETLAIVAVGAIGGLAIAWSLIGVITKLPAADLPRIATTRLDGSVLLFSVAVCCAATMLAGLAPALRASRTSLTVALREGGRRTSGSVSSVRLRRGLIACEIALACVVLVGAGLLLKSFSRLVNVDAGFVPDNLLTMNVGLMAYKEPAQRVAAISAVLDQLSRLPGVQYAGGSTGLPPVTPQRSTRFAAEGVTLARSEDSAYFIAASPDYFHAAGTRLIAGRAFSRVDSSTSPKVLILSEGLARRVFPNQNAVGKHLRVTNPDTSDEWRTVVGVVQTIRYSGLSDPDQPAVYAPFSQSPMFWMYVLVRHSPDTAGLAQSVRAAVQTADPKLTPIGIQPMDAVLAGTVAQPRFRTGLLSAFAAIALLLAAIGIYGVIAYTVTQRIQELGIRLALGATRRSVLSLVLLDSLRLCAVALAIGIPAALVAGRSLRTMLFNVSAADPIIIAGVAILLVVVALGAGYIPARRASRLDPLAALRYE